MTHEEQKHTPGPWIMEHDEEEGTVTVWAGSAIEDRHCGMYDSAGAMELYSSVYLDGDSTESDEECLANARLIAASPRLLAACETALHELRVRCGYKGDEAAYVELSAAIAEATGRHKVTHYAIYQLADDEATYGPNAGKFIVTTADHEDEVSGPMSEKDARSLAAALNACRMVLKRWERGDLAEAARACTEVVLAVAGRAS